jgi:hypothetical protein
MYCDGDELKEKTLMDDKMLGNDVSRDHFKSSADDILCSRQYPTN